MVASEANPLAKTGGLADVVYSLSKELVQKRQEVAIIMPYYSSIHNKLKANPEFVFDFVVSMSWRKQLCRVFRTEIEGIVYYLLENAQYFARKNLYGYHDDNERFAFFTIAVKEVIYRLELYPDVIHLHDWQPGMLPAILKEGAVDERIRRIRYVLTIHNPAFKGFFDPYFLGDYYGLDSRLYEDGTVRFQECVSSLKTAIVYADKVTTVSPTHREELLYSDISNGLNSVIEYRKDDFVGILNGIDYGEFSPSHDDKIFQKYNGNTFVKGKEENKKLLLEKLNLAPGNEPLYGMVSRLTWQKGLDILLPALRMVLERGSKVVILGSGEYNYEQQLEYLRSEYPSRLAIYIGYNDELAHQIYAASDFFLMPSLFEPCGISQMISLKYATLPIIRITGGLKDTVIPYMDGNLEEANGFGFYDYTKEAMEGTLDWCEKCYQDKEVLMKLRRHALKADNDWKISAKKYLDLYRSIQK